MTTVTLNRRLIIWQAKRHLALWNLKNATTDDQRTGRTELWWDEYAHYSRKIKKAQRTLKMVAMCA